jgi:toxin CcdB
MPQFDVLANPIPRARRALPFVMILQSDLIETGRDRVVAPLAPSANMPPLAGRLIPVITLRESAYALLVPSLTTMPAADLHQVVANLANDRDRIMAALDYLFLGF